MMDHRNAPDNLWIPLAEPGHTGQAATPEADNALAVRPLGEGITAVEAHGALTCVVLSPAAWQRVQALDGNWRRLFYWALRHIDTPTARQMAAAAECALNGRSGRAIAPRRS